MSPLARCGVDRCVVLPFNERLAAQSAQSFIEDTLVGALGVKYVLSPECGHAYSVLRWEGPNIIGRPFGFEVLHITELLDRLRAEGRLVTEGAEAARLTYHDPCQNTRRGGLPREPR